MHGRIVGDGDIEDAVRRNTSMRRPVRVKTILVFLIGSLALSRAARVAILSSALFVERFFARCQLGVLVFSRAAT
jgi:hypothetical protein